MLFVIIVLPLFTSLLSSSIGFYIGRQGSVFITLFCVILSNLVSNYHLLELCNLSITYYVTFSPWVCIDLLFVNWGFLFDTVSIIMLTMVLSISLVVHIYSTSYMSIDPHLVRFMSYLSLFTFFMLFLIVSDNLIQLFLGWEGVGICSYLLINFWFARLQSNKSGLKALVMNRIGDIGLLIGILTLFYYFRTVDFSIVFVLVPYFLLMKVKLWNKTLSLLFIISIFLFIGSIGKSAQLGLHTWLSDVMEE